MGELGHRSAGAWPPAAQFLVCWDPMDGAASSPVLGLLLRVFSIPCGKPGCLDLLPLCVELLCLQEKIWAPCTSSGFRSEGC